MDITNRLLGQTNPFVDLIGQDTLRSGLAKAVGLDKKIGLGVKEDDFFCSYPSEKTNIFFLRLRLLNRNKQLVSDNFYWSSSDYQDYNGLNDLPEIKLKAEAKKTSCKGKSCIEIKLTNPSPAMALMISVKITDPETGERILPAFWSDNYFSLVPGETKTVSITPENAIPNDCLLLISGWNIMEQTLKISNQD